LNLDVEIRDLTPTSPRRIRAAGTDREATAAAVEAVHSQYEKVEGLLR